MEFVLINSLGCELGRYPVQCDELGYPLVLATINDDVDVRTMLDELQPGDTIHFLKANAQ